MTYTALPSKKGQITLPPAIRKKYHISKETPIVIEDAGNGIITMKVMRLADHDFVEFYENKSANGLRFPKGVDPKVLINALKKIDG